MRQSGTLQKLFSKWLINTTLLLFILLSGCETAPPKQVVSTEPADWKFRQARLADFNSWSIKGKLAVNQPDRNDILVINQWRQHQGSFNIHISSFLGLGATQITGTQEFLSIHQPDEPVLHSTQPEQLLQETLGWALPLNSLAYWIKGLPAPGKPADINFDQEGNPHRIRQTQWQVILDRYKPVGDLMLPGKITLTQKQIKVKVVITQWTELCGDC